MESWPRFFGPLRFSIRPLLRIELVGSVPYLAWPVRFNDLHFSSSIHSLISWSTAETSTYIVTACLPNLKPLLSHYTPRRIKLMIHKSASYENDSLSRQRRSSRGEDEVQLTARSKKKLYNSNSIDLERNPSRPVLSHHLDPAKIVTFDAEGSFDQGIKTTVRNSSVDVATEGFKDGINVQTEVKIERSPSTIRKSPPFL